ncbi:MAG: hypothetical protein KatS3mg094_299 [Candidatus Parcubacteria bacterium]|nr:MAG: hypothetical protein KatS3mg094_299 [Candidatus Parcubacteria bacterium]
MIIIKSLKDFKEFINNYLFSLVEGELLKNKKLILILKGNLGAGKTTLVKLLAKKLKIKDNIISPTFILWRIYLFNLKSQKFKLNHIDLYRISANELLKLSLKTKINEKYNLFLIEWGEKLIFYLNKNKLKYFLVEIKILSKQKRLIYLKWKK